MSLVSGTPSRRKVASHPYIVGLTGGIGCGKSTVGHIFESLGILVIDADQIAHSMTGIGGEAMPEIMSVFGPDIADASGALDRKAMRLIVFNNPTARAELESILHPRIKARMESLTSQAMSPYVVHMIPLLIESGDPRSRVHRILVVDCPESAQIERVSRRSHLQEDEVRRIIKAQTSRSERLRWADDVVENIGRVEDLTERVKHLDQSYRTLSQKTGEI